MAGLRFRGPRKGLRTGPDASGGDWSQQTYDFTHGGRKVTGPVNKRVGMDGRMRRGLKPRTRGVLGERTAMEDEVGKKSAVRRRLVVRLRRLVQESTGQQEAGQGARSIRYRAGSCHVTGPARVVHAGTTWIEELLHWRQRNNKYIHGHRITHFEDIPLMVHTRQLVKYLFVMICHQPVVFGRCVQYLAVLTNPENNYPERMVTRDPRYKMPVSFVLKIQKYLQ